jgi:hypothetical protein
LQHPRRHLVLTFNSLFESQNLKRVVASVHTNMSSLGVEWHVIHSKTEQLVMSLANT